MYVCWQYIFIYSTVICKHFSPSKGKQHLSNHKCADIYSLQGACIRNIEFYNYIYCNLPPLFSTFLEFACLRLRSVIYVLAAFWYIFFSNFMSVSVSFQIFLHCIISLFYYYSASQRYQVKRIVCTSAVSTISFSLSFFLFLFLYLNLSFLRFTVSFPFLFFLSFLRTPEVKLSLIYSSTVNCSMQISDHNEHRSVLLTLSKTVFQEVSVPCLDPYLYIFELIHPWIYQVNAPSTLCKSCGPSIASSYSSLQKSGTMKTA